LHTAPRRQRFVYELRCGHQIDGVRSDNNGTAPEAIGVHLHAGVCGLDRQEGERDRATDDLLQGIDPAVSAIDRDDIFAVSRFREYWIRTVAKGQDMNELYSCRREVGVPIGDRFRSP
jgi:hypothetical protein